MESTSELRRALSNTKRQARLQMIGIITNLLRRGFKRQEIEEITGLSESTYYALMTDIDEEVLREVEAL